MKKIVMKAVPVFEKHYAVQIIEQTHRDSKFGKEDNSFCVVINKTKYRLNSASKPECRLSDPHEKAFYVRGYSKEKDDLPAIADIEELNILKILVKKYNEYFSDKDENKVKDNVIILD